MHVLSHVALSALQDLQSVAEHYSQVPGEPAVNLNPERQPEHVSAAVQIQLVAHAVHTPVAATR